MSRDARWESESATITDVKPPTGRTYEPFADDDAEFDVQKWPTKSDPPGTVQGDTKAPAKGKQ